MNKEITYQQICQAMRKFSGNQEKAARKLKVSPEELFLIYKRHTRGDLKNTNENPLSLIVFQETKVFKILKALGHDVTLSVNPQELVEKLTLTSPHAVFYFYDQKPHMAPETLVHIIPGTVLILMHTGELNDEAKQYQFAHSYLRIPASQEKIVTVLSKTIKENYGEHIDVRCCYCKTRKKKFEYFSEILNKGFGLCNFCSKKHSWEIVLGSIRLKEEKIISRESLAFTLKFSEWR